MPVAREALARDITRRGIPTTADQLLLTASTSEAYGLLFKVFADPGALIAAPRPSYPLIQHLAELEGLRVAPYDLVYDGRRWGLDLAGVRASLEAGARAVVLVSPNNPTGSVATAGELAQLREMCAARDVPLIVDQVFASYGLELGDVPLAGGAGPGLVLVLDGLSKRAGMPQLKLAWTAVYGDAAHEVMTRLEWVNDLALSVATPVQVALPALLEIGDDLQRHIAERVRGNYARLREVMAPLSAIEVLHAEAGWYALVRVPRVLEDDELIVRLARAGVLVQPGYLYDLSERGVLVLSLLPAPTELGAAVGVLARELAALC